MVKKMRKGFTLIELLIVIVIIGILAAALLLSSGSATDSAEASTIVSDLRSLASATMLWYGDNIGAITLPPIASIATYAANPVKYNSGNYVIVEAGSADGWLVGNTAVINKDGVRQKLTDRASAVGLYQVSGTALYNGGAAVYMFAR